MIKKNCNNKGLIAFTILLLILLFLPNYLLLHQLQLIRLPGITRVERSWHICVKVGE